MLWKSIPRNLHQPVKAVISAVEVGAQQQPPTYPLVPHFTEFLAISFWPLCLWSLPKGAFQVGIWLATTPEKGCHLMILQSSRCIPWNH
ncbi:hypothetical protein A4A49_25668 [Nicotiana attenuata]|uniref:Uncharacterized protein n=1 Tax=Nicotiana attenuata TaxID=49451 RepID=A0A314KL00_NICAT|nr:hypothetical protein A4A49_25668 [Nicotiana attenuata]